MTNNLSTSTKIVKFTERQITVLKLWAKLPNEAAIATELGVSPHTIHTHLRRMREKLKVRRTFDLWKHLQEEGLV